MINQLLTGTPSSRRGTTLPATLTTSGVPIFVGALAGVTLDSFQTNIDGATVLFSGCFALEVVAKSSLSPVVNAAIAPGDPIYAVGGTTDAATNVRSGFTLCADSSGTLFGYLDPQTNPAGIASGTTNEAAGVSINSLS